MRNKEDITLKDALLAMLKSYRLERGYHQTRLRALWPRLMGPAVAGYTREIRLQGKVLYIHLDSAPLRHELSLGRDKLCELLNKELGEDFLQEVKLF